MKSITLKKLDITNFKGVHRLTIDFNPVTYISGDNATFKTTIFDAFTWMLFGKDSADREGFQIKRLDLDGNPIQKTECEVLGELDVNGKEVTIKRIFKEIWTKKRGSEEAVFSGNEQLFYYNDVPLKAGEYQAKINGLIDGEIFKLITNVLYFNTNNSKWGWQQRRKILVDMAGAIDDESLLATDSRFASLVAQLQNVSLAELKKTIAAKKKKLKDELDMIPVRVDELSRSLPKPLDWITIKSDIHYHQAEVKAIDEILADKSKKSDADFKILQDHQRKVYELQSKKDRQYYAVKEVYDRQLQDAGKDLRNKKSELLDIDRQLTSKTQYLTSISTRIKDLQTSIDKKRQEWAAINSETIKIDEHVFICPSCKRALDPIDIDDKRNLLEANFNDDKAKKLSGIQIIGKKLSTELSGLESEVEIYKAEVASLTSQKASVEAAITTLVHQEQQTPQPLETFLDADNTYQTILKELSELTAKTPQTATPDNTSELNSKQQHVGKLDELKRQLGLKDQIDNGNTRIAELQKQEKSYAQQLADLESTEFLINEFSKAKIEMVESRINGKFKVVRFKMFKTLINGGEEEACEAMVDGVPFSDLNTASKINAGLDIINALCEHYQVHAPIFIDNRESVSELLQSDSQIVNLIVTRGQAELKVA